jgi:protein transport protein SEC61 subunit beta
MDPIKKFPTTMAQRRRGGGGDDGAGVLKFYTDENAEFKIQPTTVLACSLAFIGLVVLLHISAKFRSDD